MRRRRAKRRTSMRYGKHWTRSARFRRWRRGCCAGGWGGVCGGGGGSRAGGTGGIESDVNVAAWEEAWCATWPDRSRLNFDQAFVEFGPGACCSFGGVEGSEGSRNCVLFFLVFFE